MRVFQRDRHMRADLSAYADGQLDPRRQEAVDGHLAGCASCRQEVEELRTVIGLLGRVAQVDAPRSFALTEAPRMAPAWAVRYTAPLRYATATAALLLVAVVTGDLVASSQGSVPATAAMEAELDTEPATAESQFLDAAAPDEMPALAPAAAAEARGADGGGEEAAPAQELAEPGGPNLLLRWIEAVLGLLFAALAMAAAVQWLTGRRIRAG